MKKRIISLGLFLLLFVLTGCQAQHEKTAPISIKELQQSGEKINNKKEVNYSSAPIFDFRLPAKKVMPGVVHILSTFEGKNIPRGNFDLPEFFKDFFGEDFWSRSGRPDQAPRAQIGSGSGVIITDDGYIVTNNHVVKDADEIEVILSDNRSYPAKVIGTDPATDLALLKIAENKLPFVKIGDSDRLEVGEWVLAVGNPFNLSTTVTAGIVSAKARNINIIQDKSSIEAFIQTDAAVNQGNSGGALVNMEGELVGINTAIASPTGIYAGYSFAVPINIAKKVVDDLLNFGEVQRAYLGVYIRNLDSKLAKELDLEKMEGVYVDSIVAGSAAEQAAILEKDVIVKIDGENVATSPRLQEIIGRHRPGDKVNITLMRNGKEKNIEVLLKGISGEEKMVKKERSELLEILGIDIENISAKEKNKWAIKGAVKITKIYPGKIKKYTDIKTGFIVTEIDKKKVYSVDDFIKILEEYQGGVMLTGFYPDNPDAVYYYAFGM